MKQLEDMHTNKDYCERGKFGVNVSSCASSKKGINMKNIKQLSLIVLTTLMISSCATTANYTEIVKTWKGSDINNLITSWGPPSDVFTMPNGNKMYTWLYTNNSLVTTNYNQWLNRLETKQVQYWCKTTFTADKNNIIIDWRWEGNACRAVKK